VNHVSATRGCLHPGCNRPVGFVGNGGVMSEPDSKYMIDYRCLNCGMKLGQIDVGEPTPVLYPSARVEWVDGVGRCKLDCGTVDCPGRMWEPIPKPAKKK